MQALNQIIQDQALSKRLAMTWDSSECTVHNIKRMIIDGEAVCPRCELEHESEQVRLANEREILESMALAKYRVLPDKSLIQDDSIKLATFDNYKEFSGEERANKQRALQLVESLKQGHQRNIWLQSEITGVGKSHLAMAILKALNSKTVSTLFIDIDEMLRKIRGTFDNKESPFTEQYFIDLCTEVDFLVLDDLGAETGDIDTKKRASDYTSRILRAIQNGRQLKSTIITTNLTSERLNAIYDRKVISRLMKNIEVIRFVEATDKRIKDIGF